jgi:hypothetical protein
MDDMSGTGLGGRTWAAILGLVVAAVAVGAIVFIVFGWVWYAWGFFGALLCFGAALLGFGYVYDRRERNRRKRLAG